RRRWCAEGRDRNVERRRGGACRRGVHVLHRIAGAAALLGVGEPLWSWGRADLELAVTAKTIVIAGLGLVVAVGLTACSFQDQLQQCAEAERCVDHNLEKPALRYPF